MSRHSRFAALFGFMLAAAPAAIDCARAQNHPENDPNFCKTIWQDIGLPKAASGSGGQTTIVCHKDYIVGHNDRNKTPNWVIERLTPKLTDGKAARAGDNFSPDDKLPPDAQAKKPDYDTHGSEFDKGHNAPAADFGGDQAALDDTFFFSNAVPQIGAGFNRSIWKSLETQVRDLVGSNHPLLYVITGPVYQESQPIKVKAGTCPTELTLPTVKPVSICPENQHNANTPCAAGVAVPAAMYKIVYEPVMKNAFVVLMENKNHTGSYPKNGGRSYIQAHRVGLDTIEELTGLSFFTALPERKLRTMRSACVDVRVH